MLHDRQRAISEMAELYDTQLTSGQIDERQVEKFNHVWQYCLREVPFYQQWAREHSLPGRISRSSDLDHFPMLRKRDIIENESAIFRDGKIVDAYSTGGTTGTPTRYPKGKGEAAYNYVSTYVGRRWWGIYPFDSYVHLWGHSHLFAEGFRGRIGKAKRHLADRLVQATRVNAYDMTGEALGRHYDALRLANPTYLVGYTSAVVKLSHFIERNGLPLDELRQLKAAIVTAETVSEQDAALIGEVLRVPVVTEYGSAETGTIAVSRGATWPMQVFWDGFMVRVGHNQELRITTLMNRLFPLINYEIGDVGDPVLSRSGNAHALSAVYGRTQDVVRVGTADGRILDLSAILPVHILKNDKRIFAVQFRQENDRMLRIFIAAAGDLDLTDTLSNFSQQMKKDHPAFDPSTVVFEQVSEPWLTRAGKHALFVS